MFKIKLPCACVAVSLMLAGADAMRADAAHASAQRRARKRPAVVCGDPTVPCKTSVEFKPYQLPFVVPKDGVIADSEKFYAVILKSLRDAAQDCTVAVPESERLKAQELFPRNKVFASRCNDPEELYYSNLADGQQFMAVFAGRTRAEAERVLAKVKAAGKYPGAYLRHMTTGFNGT
jgi:hypothetical protein